MAKLNALTPGLGRLLDGWVAPSSAGAPIGCLATSYTFDSVFFEEQCLARFAGIRTGAADESMVQAYLVEREERLSQIKAVALVDKDHCRGPRSPRWDLMCARGGAKGGILHAKLSLLIWAKHMRLVVGSANLTPSGYRRNHEVYLVLEAAPDLTLAREAFRDALTYLASLIELAGGQEHPAVGRWLSLIEEAQGRLKSLSRVCPEPEELVTFHGVRPGGIDLFRQLEKAWANASGVPRSLYAISPFFDEDIKAAERVKDKLWGLGANRGALDLILTAPSMGLAGGANKGAVKLLAPVVYDPKLYPPPRESCRIAFSGVEEIDPVELERRPLHAKAISIENDRWALTYTGSSNLTHAGLGLHARANWEAGTSVLVDWQRHPEAYKLLEAAWDAIDGVELENYVLSGERAADPEELVVGGIQTLPDAFHWALFRRQGEKSIVELSLSEGQPEGWELFTQLGERLAGQQEWLDQGSMELWSVSWPYWGPPSGLELRWKVGGEGCSAWLPVCAADTKDLPPPEELRQLPLELLIEVLTAARPLAQVVAAYLVRRSLRVQGEGPQLDPHKRVDVSGYLIPRTRRISTALRALRQRLEEPCATKEALGWRLRGPFGAKAVLEAIERESKSEEERSFFTAELCLELANAQPKAMEGGISVDEVRDSILEFVGEQADQVEKKLHEVGSGLKEYVSAALSKARRMA